MPERFTTFGAAAVWFECCWEAGAEMATGFWADLFDWVGASGL